MNTTYNGWRNRETWLVNVWFGDNWRCADDVEATKEFMESALESVPLWMQDFIDFGCIDWRRLKEHAEEIDEYDNQKGVTQ